MVSDPQGVTRWQTQAGMAEMSAKFRTMGGEVHSEDARQHPHAPKPARKDEWRACAYRDGRERGGGLMLGQGWTRPAMTAPSVRIMPLERVSWVWMWRSPMHLSTDQYARRVFALFGFFPYFDLAEEFSPFPLQVPDLAY